jgi:hypothetical protein
MSALLARMLGSAILWAIKHPAVMKDLIEVLDAARSRAADMRYTVHL